MASVELNQCRHSTTRGYKINSSEASEVGQNVLPLNVFGALILYVNHHEFTS